MARRVRKAAEAKRRPGRPDSYHSSFIQRAVNLTLLGLTYEQLASHFGLACSKFRAMCARHPELGTAIKEAGAPADGVVANALFQRAQGCSVPETKAFLDPRTGNIKTVTYLKHYPPSEVAAMMWLSNRQRETKRWAFRQSTDLTNSDGSFAEFVKALQEQHRTLQGRFRVVEPERLTQDAA